MKKDYTYVMNKNRHKDRNQSDLNTEFTEHSIGAISASGLLKNSETKEVMLCPFNSRQTSPNYQAKLAEACKPLMENKDAMIKFGF